MIKLLLVWDWCKINWKFLLGVSIPIVISILLRRGNAAKIYKKAAETRKKELEISKVAHELETKKKQLSLEIYDDKVKDIVKDHANKVNEANRRHDETINEINSAEDATTAIKDKLK